MLMEEQWKDIIIEKNGIIYDYSRLYQVSNLGRVRSLDRVDSRGYRLKGKVLKPKQDNKGYLFVGLYKNGKQQQFYIHRLVATMFIPNPENLPVVNHLDENPSNDVWTNLEWCTISYNTKYSGHKISEAQIGRKLSEEHKRKQSEARKGKYTRKDCYNAKPVVCLNTGEKFECIMDAKDWCHGGRIGACCQGKGYSSGTHPETGEKLSWMYVEDYEKATKEEIENKIRQANETGFKGSKKVICLETTQIFDSIKEAQRWIGKGNIKQCVKSKSKSSGGYHWMYLDEWLAQQEVNVESFN